jgi:hypothetical protein
MAGLQTSFGALLIATDGSGAWALYDSANNTLVSSGGPPAQNNASGSSIDAGIILPVIGTAAANGPSRSSNCLGNGDFGAPYYYNRDASYLAFAVSSWEYVSLLRCCLLSTALLWLSLCKISVPL